MVARKGISFAWPVAVAFCVVVWVCFWYTVVSLSGCGRDVFNPTVVQRDTVFVHDTIYVERDDHGRRRR